MKKLTTHMSFCFFYLQNILGRSKYIIAALFLFLTAGQLKAQTSCSASFVHYPLSNNSDSIHFYPTGNNPSNTHYYWSFGDGTYSDMFNPTHVYQSAGTYIACLGVVDTLQNGVICTDKQ